MTPPLTFQRMVVATDFGSAAGRAADTAAGLAERFGGSIMLLYVQAVPLTFAGVPQWPVEALDDGAQNALDNEVSRLRRLMPRVEGVRLTGEPWELVLETAAEHEADAIVIGTHGRHGLTRMWLGSVAERVVRMSPIPVLIVHASRVDAAD